MKNIILLFIILININIYALDIKKWHTPEGAKVLFTQTKGLPMLDIMISFDAASARDGDNFGIANLVSDMIGINSKHHNKEQIINKIKALGIIISSASHQDMMNISMRSLTDKNKMFSAVALLSEIVGEAVFLQDELNNSKRKIKHNIKLQQQYPHHIVNKIFNNTIFANHPYGHQAIGTKESIANIHLNDVINFYNKYFVANNMNISIVGDIDIFMAKQISRLISHKFDSGNKPPALKKVQKLIKKQQIYVDFPSTQSHIMIGQTGVNRSHKDYYALYLGNHILGGNSLNSMLGDNIREKNGLAYSVYSYLKKMAANGYFAIKLQTANKNTQQAITIAKQTLQDLINDIDDDLLQDSKDNIKGSFAISLSTNTSIVTYLAIMGFYDLPLNYINNFYDNIAKLTSIDVKNALNRLINMDTLLTVVVGKSQANNL